jgi:transposase-like protein
MISALLRKLFGVKKKSLFEPVKVAKCPECGHAAVRDGESGSTGEARYFCPSCHHHFFSGGWGSEI